MKLRGDTHFLLEMIENMSRLEETCPGQIGTGIDLHFRGILEMEDSLPQETWGIVHQGPLLQWVKQRNYRAKEKGRKNKLITK